MGRNAHGLGRKPHRWRGRWRAYLTVGYRSDGEPDRIYVYGKTERECQAKLDELRRQERHAAVDSRHITVGEYLTTWLDEAAPTLSERGAEIYAAELAHLRPHIGKVKLTALTSAHVKKAMRSIVGTTVEFGRKGADGKQTAVLTARAANTARVVLHKALADAVLDGLIPFNPASREFVKPLKIDATEITVWTAAEIEQFLATASSGACSLYAFFYLALTTGLRVGELGALEWRDLQGDSLHVTRTIGGSGTKTPAGRRIVPVPADARQVLDVYRATKALDGVETPLVFSTSPGGHITRQLARTSLLRWSNRAGVTALTPHGLRHTFASMMIAAGVDAATLARTLGHKSPAFTMKRYVHFFERAQARQALTLAELTGSRERLGVFLGGTNPQATTEGAVPN